MIATSELYKRHRPSTLNEVVGQPEACRGLWNALKSSKLPHTCLFSGPSGTGKTTLMRILRRLLKCSERDFVSVNSANFRGIDTVREIQKQINLQPMAGGVRIFAIDECHKMTNDAQNAILTMLEDTPEHVYFFLATTDPQKLLKAVLTRCTEYKLKAVDAKDIFKVLKSICAKEQFTHVPDRLLTKIADGAEGSVRKAVVILDAVSKEETEQAMIQAIQITLVDEEGAFRLASEMMFGNDGWPRVAAILQELKDEDPEGIRHMVLSFARSCLIGKSTLEIRKGITVAATAKGQPLNPRSMAKAAMVINFFGTHFYDSKHAGLAFACFNVMHTKS
jgi:DNA polymerase III gamma/tau subunit